MRIIPRSEWGARYQDGYGNRKIGRLEKYLHHSVTTHLPATATVEQEKAEMRRIEAIGQQRFGVGISYTLVVFPSGRVYEGHSIGRIGAHSGSGRNTRGAGICLAGNYETHKLGRKTRDAIVWLLQHGVNKGWWTDPALTEGHRDFKQTACPGRYAYREIGQINKLGRGKTVEPKPTKPKKPAKKKGGKQWPAVPLPITKKHTSASDRAWRKLLADVGYKNSNLTKRFQRWLRDLGYYKGRIDGDFGPYTINALQHKLHDDGLYNGAFDAFRAPYHVARGPVMIAAEIRYLNDQRQYY